MKPVHHFRSVRRTVLVAALGFVTVGAQAALGYQVTKDQEAQVKVGMSIADVRLALGQPSSNMKYRNEPGPTFTYQVSSSTEAVFDVDFGADGRVLSTNERLIDMGGGGRGHHAGRR